MDHGATNHHHALAANGGGGGARLVWGIACATDQLLLSYPRIGLGIVKDQHHHSLWYVAACLRGGTTYLVPIMTKASSLPSSTPTQKFNSEDDISFCEQKKCFLVE